MTLRCTMILGDCLDVMPTQEKASAAMAFCDLPYGVSNCHWDVPISLPAFWKAISWQVKRAGAVACTATQPFTTALVHSNLKAFMYDLVWAKKRSTGFFNAKRAPLRCHESVLLFGNRPDYNPQMVAGKKYNVSAHVAKNGFFGKPHIVNATKSTHSGTDRYPRSILEFDETDLRRDSLNGHTGRICHPTQKPIALLDWLIRTYSNAGETVLDPVAGSFTTTLAASSSGRHSVCIEKDEGYFAAGVERVRKHIRDNGIDAKINVRR